MTSVPAIPFPVVGLGASAGGLDAVQSFLSGVDAEAGMAYVLVQHLDPHHDSLLSELLGRRAAITVRQIEDGDVLEPDTLFVIPPGFALRVDGNRLQLDSFSEPRGLRRPIDDFFESLAVECAGECAVAVLSGTGADGAMGIRRVKGEGGLVVVQDPETAAYDGMPDASIRTGLADHICAPDEMPALIASYFERNTGPDSEDADDVLERLDDICETIGQAVGHDFTNYKHSTLVRRVRRRMQVVGADTASEYLSRLRADNAECSALFTDLLINVTQFFRDTKAFAALDKEVVRPMVKDLGANDTVRVWVPGCSSGEEAYSIAMLIDRALEGRDAKPFVQIFATDIDETMLEVAKSARYPVAALADIPEEFREACTVSSTTHFQIAPHIRDMVRVSAHSLIKDPPFSRLDLISCRNLLIYMNGRMQDGLLPLFHYAIKPGGALFLGPAESATRREDLFATDNLQARIYRRRPGRTPEALNLPIGGVGRRPVASLRSRMKLPSPPQGLAQRRLLDAYTPAHVLIGANGEVLETSGRLGRYFTFPSGTLSTHVVTLALPGLRGPLGDALHRVGEDSERVVMRDLEVKSEFGTQTIDLVVDPLPDQTTLIVIRDVAAFRAETDDDVTLPLERDARTQGLEDALDTARLQLRTTVEELETTNEELKSSNEEMMSMNEELQSANEELTTVNDELKSKMDKLAQANDDQSNFLASTDLALIVLDEGLNIRMFTHPAEDVFPLSETDIGRPLSSFAPKVDDGDIVSDAERVLATGREIARNVTSGDGEHHYAMRILPYRTLDGTVEGVTLTFADTTNLRDAQTVAEMSNQRLELALNVTGVGVWEAYPDTGISVCDAAVRDMFGISRDRKTLRVEDVLERVDPRDLPSLEESFAQAIETGSEYRTEFRVRDTRPERWLVGIGRMVEPERGPPRMVGVNYDITHRKEAERQLTLLVRELDHRVKNLFAVVLGMLRAEARRTDDAATLVRNVEARLSALARAHDASRGQTDAQTTDLGVLVGEVLRPYGVGERVILSGKALPLPVHYTTPFGLILHELATNAQKYGALSGDAGRVEVDWSLTEPGELTLTWQEIGGPEIKTSPDLKGFGYRLINQSVAQLQGRLEPRWEAEGLRLDVVLPIES